MQTPENQLKHYQHILLRNPKDLAAQIECGNLCVELGRFEEAAGYFRRLVRILKTNLNVRDALCYALQALGNESHALGNFAMAEACFSEALAYEPNNAAYLYNLGNALRELGKPKEAALHYQKALTITPNDADIHNNLGNVQRELGALDLAITSYQKALSLNPTLFHAKVHLVHQKQHICDWAGLDDDITQIRHWVKTMPSAQISPFAFLAMPGTTAEEQKQCATNWVQNRYASLIKQAQQLNFQYKKNHQKIRIAYLSADFRLHPLAFLITELIELHDRNQFEVFAFSYGVNDQSSARARLEKAFDQFIDIRQLSDLDAAKKINACEIDILVDLTGFTQTSRTGIAALCPAPINVNWLGFAGTMGNLPSGKPLFDYLLTDHFITPPESALHYAEQLVNLPCYQPNDRNRPIGITPSRAECGLPEHAFVFCCFNQTFKITPEVFRVWMQILQATPNSVLWLLDCNVWAKQNLLREAEQLEVSKERLVFAPRVSIADHLARHKHADLFLDTAPYNAHTTCSDALWMGLPVLTCAGETFASRVAGSLLQSVALPELITFTLDDYKCKAITLAAEPQKLDAIRKKLQTTKNNAHLFNTVDFAKSLESSYQRMLKQHLS
ncbi:MAG TPA: tetratricopeptide repeat protein [Methylotenera sp.]|nr:tetratricopeptide repeat protein [Methylotenera sp.]HPH04818.1 tetratricopeptide repeat protein [Methylotenera sp.]HPN01732.1 tetratricopeptide repeat protein [Methylotenera sp.]